MLGTLGELDPILGDVVHAGQRTGSTYALGANPWCDRKGGRDTGVPGIQPGSRPEEVPEIAVYG